MGVYLHLGLPRRKGVRWDRVFKRWDPWGPGRRYGRVGRWDEEGNGSEICPRTPLWSRNEVAIVCVGSLWVARPFGSHMAIWSMQEAWSGFEGGREVGVVGPSDLSEGNFRMLASFAARPVQLPWKSQPNMIV